MSNSQAEKAPSVQAVETIAYLHYARKKPDERDLSFWPEPTTEQKAKGWVTVPLAAPQQSSVQDGEKAVQALEKILKIVQDYLPLGGTPGHKAMTQILEVVDPWPLEAAPKGQP